MNIKKDFVLRQLAGTWIVLPLAADTVNFSGMLTLNDSGVLLWNALEKGADQEALVKTLTSQYEVEEKVARADVDVFIEKLAQAGCIEM